MATKTSSRKSTKRGLTDEERAERISAAKEQLDSAVETLLTADGWKAMIESRRWLSKYSFANFMMILAQCPNATDVRSFNQWKAVGRFAVKGSKALKIWAPSMRKTEVKVLTPHGDGSVTEDTEERKTVGRFILVNVFDVSQTDGEPLPVAVDSPHAELLTGNAPAELWDKLAALVKEEGFSLERGECEGAHGWTEFGTKTVRILDTLAEAQATKTLAHELAHILCEHDKRDYLRERGACETEAESVACIVANVAGLDSGAYSVPYVAGWAGDVATVKAAAQRVLRVADEMIKRLDLSQTDKDSKDLAA